MNDVNKIGAQLSPCNRMIQGYSGAQINVLGETNLNFKCCGVKFIHKFIVVNSDVNLLGRDVARKLKMSLVINGDNGGNSINHISILRNFN